MKPTSTTSLTLEWLSTELIDAKEAYNARDYARVVQLLYGVPRDQLLTAPEYGFMLADSARRVGGVADVLELTSAVVDRSRERFPATFCEALNLLGVLQLERGHAQAAERTWCELVDVATQDDSPSYVARASNNLGVAAILSMRLEEAISSLQRACAAYMRMGYSRGLAQSNQNLGIVYRELDRMDDAHGHFQRAITFAYAADCLDDVARAEEEMALLFVYNGKDCATAMPLAQSALKRFTELKQPSGIAQSMRVIGICNLATGQIDAAERSLHASLALASERKLRLLEAETLLALATLVQKKEMQGHARMLREQAERIFADIYAVPWGEQVAARMAALI